MKLPAPPAPRPLAAIPPPILPMQGDTSSEHGCGRIAGGTPFPLDLDRDLGRDLGLEPGGALWVGLTKRSPTWGAGTDGALALACAFGRADLPSCRRRSCGSRGGRAGGRAGGRLIRGGTVQ